MARNCPRKRHVQEVAAEDEGPEVLHIGVVKSDEVDEDGFQTIVDKKKMKKKVRFEKLISSCGPYPVQEKTAEEVRARNTEEAYAEKMHVPKVFQERVKYLKRIAHEDYQKDWKAKKIKERKQDGAVQVQAGAEVGGCVGVGCCGSDRIKEICPVENIMWEEEGVRCVVEDPDVCQTCEVGVGKGQWVSLGVGDITVDSAADESCWPGDIGEAFD